MYMPTKSYLRKKAIKLCMYKVMYKGSNCDRKSQLSEILTEPLNPRGCFHCIDIYDDGCRIKLTVFTFFKFSYTYLNTCSIMFLQVLFARLELSYLLEFPPPPQPLFVLQHYH